MSASYDLFRNPQISIPIYFLSPISATSGVRGMQIPGPVGWGICEWENKKRNLSLVAMSQRGGRSLSARKGKKRRIGEVHPPNLSTSESELYQKRQKVSLFKEELPIMKWSTDEVCDYLAKKNLSNIASIFKGSKNIYGTICVMSTDNPRGLILPVSLWNGVPIELCIWNKTLSIIFIDFRYERGKGFNLTIPSHNISYMQWFIKKIIIYWKWLGADIWMLLFFCICNASVMLALAQFSVHLLLQLKNLW